MKILVTGAKGFVGKNLCENLKNIKDGKNRCYPELKIDEIYEADVDTADDILENYCKCCDFVFHLAGVNRPQNNDEFTLGNVNALEKVLGFLKAYGNKASVMLSSSIQASGVGRYKDSPYGESKLKGEELLFSYSEENNVPVFVYRFPNLFGKWCRPNYNSAVATWCYNRARNLDIQVRDRDADVTLVYIDDVVRAFVGNITSNLEAPVDSVISITPSYTRRLGEIVDLIEDFKNEPLSLDVPNQGDDFCKKLYATFLSYLPEDAFSYPLTMHCDNRGSFTEALHSSERGQVSVNISKPGITKGQHWHHTKHEKFLVVSGNGVIRFRRVDLPNGDVLSYFVSGEKLEVVRIPPGYVHNIENLGDTDMVTLMWANEVFDPANPDTFRADV